MTSRCFSPSNLVLLLVSFTVVLWAFPMVQVTAAEPKDPPAKVDTPALEADFNKVTLTAKAESRLNIKTAAVERKIIPLVRIFGGEINIPMENHGSENPDSQSIFSVLPSMTPADRIRIAEGQVAADGVVAAAKVQLEASKVVMERTERMLNEKSGSRRSVDDARAQLRLAESELAKALAQRELLGPPVLYNTTPEGVWVRVPVYVGDLARIDNSKSVQVRPLSAASSGPGFSAHRVIAPPSANPTASAVDQFYEIENKDHPFQLGERVEVSITLKSQEDSLIVPWASVITDIYGGTWVYENTGAHQFVRQRVQVRRVAGDLAVLATGPAVGSKIVTDGAAELFGTEVGFSK